MEIIERNQIEIIELKSTISKMKKFTDSLTSMLGIVGEEVSKLEGRSIEMILTKTEKND